MKKNTSTEFYYDGLYYDNSLYISPFDNCLICFDNCSVSGESFIWLYHFILFVFTVGYSSIICNFFAKAHAMPNPNVLPTATSYVEILDVNEAINDANSNNNSPYVRSPTTSSDSSDNLSFVNLPTNLSYDLLSLSIKNEGSYHESKLGRFEFDYGSTEDSLESRFELIQTRMEGYFSLGSLGRIFNNSSLFSVNDNLRPTTTIWIEKAQEDAFNSELGVSVISKAQYKTFFDQYFNWNDFNIIKDSVKQSLTQLGYFTNNLPEIDQITTVAEIHQLEIQLENDKTSMSLIHETAKEEIEHFSERFTQYRAVIENCVINYLETTDLTTLNGITDNDNNQLKSKKVESGLFLTQQLLLESDHQKQVNELFSTYKRKSHKRLGYIYKAQIGLKVQKSMLTGQPIPFDCNDPNSNYYYIN